MKRLALLVVVLLAVPAPAWAAQKDAPAQPPPQAAPPAPTQIPLSSEPATPTKQTQAEKDRLYALLVVGCALLPVLAFLFWKFWPRESRRVRYKPYRYSSGPADPRRMRRRNKR